MSPGNVVDMEIESDSTSRVPVYVDVRLRIDPAPASQPYPPPTFRRADPAVAAVRRAVALLVESRFELHSGPVPVTPSLAALSIPAYAQRLSCSSPHSHPRHGRGDAAGDGKGDEEDDDDDDDEEEDGEGGQSSCGGGYGGRGSHAATYPFDTTLSRAPLSKAAFRVDRIWLSTPPPPNAATLPGSEAACAGDASLSPRQPAKSRSHSRLCPYHAQLHVQLYAAAPAGAAPPPLPPALRGLVDATAQPASPHDAHWHELSHPAPLKATLLSYLRTRAQLAVDSARIPPSPPASAANGKKKNTTTAYNGGAAPGDCAASLAIITSKGTSSALSLSLSSSASPPPLSGLVLLAGRPGTGKTALAHALAAMACVRAQRDGVLLHARLHRLSSRWFGETPKLMARLLRGARALARGGRAPVTLLLDEVDAVAGSRSAVSGGGPGGEGVAGSGGSGPADMRHGVNALLVGLDALVAHSNNCAHPGAGAGERGDGGSGRLLVIGTTNFASALDDAFVDRADLQLRVDGPSVQMGRAMVEDAVVQLVLGGVVRLSRTDLVEDDGDETGGGSDANGVAEDGVSSDKSHQQQQEQHEEEMGQVRGAVRRACSLHGDDVWAAVGQLSGRRIAKLAAIAVAAAGGPGVSVRAAVAGVQCVMRMEAQFRRGSSDASAGDGERERRERADAIRGSKRDREGNALGGDGTDFEAQVASARVHLSDPLHSLLT